MVALAWGWSTLVSLAVVEGDGRWMCLNKSNDVQLKRALRDDHVGATAASANKVGQVRYPHASKIWATAPASAQVIACGGIPGQSRRYNFDAQTTTVTTNSPDE